VREAPRPEASGSGVDLSAVPVVHAVTDDLILTRPAFLERALDVMRALGGRGAVHLRSRLIPSRRVFALAEALRLAQQETGCRLVINDRLDIAMGVGAWGAQLTTRSIPVSDARRMAPAMALGASVHAVDQAIEADRGGATWLVAGHVFDTTSHAGVPGRGLSFVRAVREASSLPLLAIGGVTAERVGELRAAGAHGVAVIRGIWGARDAEMAAREYLTTYDADGGTAARDRGDRER
jgi:thiamine-phosphate pyrophosphorylase